MQKSPSIIAAMFNRIAPRYDLVNRLTSFGQDVRWRKKIIAKLPPKKNMSLLDLATGTGDVLITLAPYIQTGLGLDISTEMIKVGQQKIKSLPNLKLQEGDATNLTLQDTSIDAITMAFGIRNVDNVPKALSEMYRVLTPGGRTLILEFSLPKNPLIKWGYLFYFRHILPLIGGLISGNKKAYHYLNQSVESFPYGEQFCTLLANAGFHNIQTLPLCFGVATLYQGDRES